MRINPSIACSQNLPRDAPLISIIWTHLVRDFSSSPCHTYFFFAESQRSSVEAERRGPSESQDKGAYHPPETRYPRPLPSFFLFFPPSGSVSIMVLPKSKKSVGLGSQLMRDRLTGGKGNDRKRGSAVARVDHASGEQVCPRTQESLFIDIYIRFAKPAGPFRGATPIYSCFQTDSDSL